MDSFHLSGTSEVSQLLFTIFNKSLWILVGICLKKMLCIISYPGDFILRDLIALFSSEITILLFISI